MKLLGVVSVLIILIGMTVSWLKTYVKIDQIVRFKREICYTSITHGNIKKNKKAHLAADCSDNK